MKVNFINSLVQQLGSSSL